MEVCDDGVGSVSARIHARACPEAGDAASDSGVFNTKAAQTACVARAAVGGGVAGGAGRISAAALLLASSNSGVAVRIPAVIVSGDPRVALASTVAVIWMDIGAPWPARSTSVHTKAGAVVAGAGSAATKLIPAGSVTVSVFPPAKPPPMFP